MLHHWITALPHELRHVTVSQSASLAKSFVIHKYLKGTYFSPFSVHFSYCLQVDSAVSPWEIQSWSGLKVHYSAFAKVTLPNGERSEHFGLCDVFTESPPRVYTQVPLSGRTAHLSPAQRWGQGISAEGSGIQQASSGARSPEPQAPGKGLPLSWGAMALSFKRLWLCFAYFVCVAIGVCGVHMTGLCFPFQQKQLLAVPYSVLQWPRMGQSFLLGI